MAKQRCQCLRVAPRRVACPACGGGGRDAGRRAVGVLPGHGACRRLLALPAGPTQRLLRHRGGRVGCRPVRTVYGHSVRAPLLRQALALRRLGGLGLPAGAGRGLRGLGPGRRCVDLRVARGRLGVRAVGGRRVLCGLLPALLPEFHAAHPARQRPVAGGHVVGRIDRRAGRGLGDGGVPLRHRPARHGWRRSLHRHEPGLPGRRHPAAGPGGRCPGRPVPGLPPFLRHRRRRHGGERDPRHVQPPAA